MFGNLLPFLMFGILLAAVLAKPMARLRWISLPVALVFIGFVSSEIWVRMGMDTGLRWEILRDLVFYLLLPVLIFEAAINIDTRRLKREAVLIGSLSVPLLLLAVGISALVIQLLMGSALDYSWPLALLIVGRRSEPGRRERGIEPHFRARAAAGSRSCRGASPVRVSRHPRDQRRSGIV